MVIVSKDGDLIARLGDPAVPDGIVLEATVRRLIAQARSGAAASAVDLSDDRCLRCFPLEGLPDTYAIFIEQTRHPPSVAELLARYPLSLREAEVVSLLVRGATSHEIADHLRIAETTVVSHVRNAGLKLGCTKRSTMIARLLGCDEADVV
ncbi:MAG: hypothetical protein NVS3B17_10750 [Vulcanimicrobiaceae bacterium]